MVGNIYTNEINYWMVVYEPLPPCKCCGAGQDFSGAMVIPVVIDTKTGQLSSIQTYKTLRLSEIKPYTRLFAVNNLTMV